MDMFTLFDCDEGLKKWDEEQKGKKPSPSKTEELNAVNDEKTSDFKFDDKEEEGNNFKFDDAESGNDFQFDDVSDNSNMEVGKIVEVSKDDLLKSDNKFKVEEESNDESEDDDELDEEEEVDLLGEKTNSKKKTSANKATPNYAKIDPNKKLEDECKKYKKIVVKPFGVVAMTIEGENDINNIKIDRITNELVRNLNYGELEDNAKWHLQPSKEEGVAYLIPLYNFQAKG